MDKLLTVKEVAKTFNFHPQTIYKWKDEGRIAFIKINGRIRFKKEDIDTWQNINKYETLITSEYVPKFMISLGKYDKMLLKGRSALGTNSKRWNYGFGAVYTRKTKQGRKRWYIDYKANGRRVRQVVKNAQTRSHAVLALHKKVAETFNREHNQGKPKKEVRFSELVDMYINDYAKANKRSWRNDQYRIEAHMKPFFGNFQAKDVTCLLVEKYRVERLKTGIMKSTVNREITIMKKMFNLAIDWKFADQNPVAKVKLFSEKDTQKERILIEEEEARLLSESPDYLKPILVVALHTGMRRGEILSLKWKQVDLDKRCIRAINTKGGKSRVVPINSLL